MYRLAYFAGVALQQFNQVDVIGSGVTPTAYQVLANGGALDLFGSMDKHPGITERTKSLRFHRDDPATLESLFFRLLALRGKRDRLVRETVSGDLHWAYARLVEVTASRDFTLTKFRSIQDIDLRFAQQDPTWRGDYHGLWYFDDGHRFDEGLNFDSSDPVALDSNPKTLTITIGAGEMGRMTSRAVRIVVDAGDASMSNVIISRTGGESLTYGASLGANGQLVIDTGAMQVKVNGADAYDNLILSPTADFACWFSLVPGDNVITVTYTGGGTGKQIEFQFFEEWA